MTTHFINGAWQLGQGASFSSIDPSKNETVWQGNGATAQQIDEAIVSARGAFREWASTSFETRLGIVEAFVELLKQHQDMLAMCIAKEMGKPLWEAKTEVAGMIGKGAISVKSYHERTGITENPMPVGKAFIRHKPHGVVAIFGPYNFPGHLPNGHIIPALLAGNCIVFKPSEMTPLVAQETIKLWQQAGLPNGVLNLVQGEIETGKALASHPQIDGLFFTGSSRTGKMLHEQFAGHPGKILALEMGGNNPLIVKDSSNVDATVHDIIQSAFISSGQRCTCARRLFVQIGEQGDAILARLVAVTKNIKVDAYDAPDQPFMGAMVSAKAASQMVDAQTKLIELGASSLLKLQQLDPAKGFVTPGIIDVTDITKLVPDEEYFGPLLQVYRYDDFDAAIDEANNTSFGLSAGLLGDSQEDYTYFYERIRAGIVNWNRPITGASGAAPFGGIGDSGNHRASAYYAADYCSYPVASVELEQVTLPSALSPGLKF